jgi:hypothetical protein
LTGLADTRYFSVVGSYDGTQSNAMVGVTYFNDQISFRIVAGPTVPFQTGDTFVFDTVLPSAIFAQNKAVVYTATDFGGYQDIEINCENLFGGNKSAGGMKGQLMFYKGTQTQPVDAYLSKQLPGVNGVAPAYHGICHAVATQIYVGTSPIVQDMAFAVQRCPNPLATSDSNILGDANPAWIIWELMTNAKWGLGIPAIRLDATSFQAAAATLYTQKMGMSMSVDAAGSADAILSDILRHIDAVLFTDPASGLWTLKLIRFDYDPATLPVLDEDNLIGPPELARVSWEETLNDIKVTYIDRSMFFSPRVVQAHESANHAVRGVIGGMSFDFKGFSNGSIAQQVVSREMKVHSYPLMKGKVVTNRIAWNFRMGQVFKLSWPPLGILDMVVRVSAINYGALEHGQIEITVVEDIFDLQDSAYSPPPFPGWTDPAGPPAPPIAQNLMEFPFFITGPSCARVVMTMAARGDDLSTVYSVEAGGVVTETDQHFTPYGTLLNAYPKNTAVDDAIGFILAATPAVDLDSLENFTAADRLVNGLTLFVIDDEILAFDTAVFNGDGTVAICDVVGGESGTGRMVHAAGAPVWFYREFAGMENTNGFHTDLAMSVKCMPVNQYGAMTDNAVTLTTESRAQLPYPPGNVLVNGLYYPDEITGDAVLTWNDRNRVAQGQPAIPQDAASVPGGIEGNYTIEVLIDGIVVHTTTGVTGNTFTYTAAQRAIDNPDGTLLTSLRITPVNGALSGTPRTVTFSWIGGDFGMFFGRFGG